MIAPWLAAAAALNPDAAPKEPPPAPVAAEQVWQQILEHPPSADPLLAEGDHEQRLILRYETAVEARSVVDGSRLWRRDDLSGSGLGSDPIASPRGAALGWAGPTENGARFRLIAIGSGETVLDTPLDAAPTGAPLPLVPQDGSLPAWAVPLGPEGVLILDPAGRPKDEVHLQEPFAPKLISLLGEPAAFAGLRHRMVALRSPTRREAPRDLDPETATAFGSLLYAAQDRVLIAWRCRRSGDGVRCRERWRQSVGGSIPAAPLADEKRVIAGSWDTALYCWRADNGHLLWRSFLPGRPSATPRRYQELLAVPLAASEAISFVRSRDGVPAGTIKAGPNELFLRAPAIAGEMLIVPMFQPVVAQPTLLRAYRLTRQAEATPPAPTAPQP